MTCSRDMEVWVPKSGKIFSQESIEEVWETWRNDDPKDECKVQLEGPEEVWWTGTEMGLLRTYWFDGNVTASDGSVGTGSNVAWVRVLFGWITRNTGANSSEERRRVSDLGEWRWEITQ
jgi:hypothetical protein